MFNEGKEKSQRDPANLSNSKMAKTNGSNETAKWAASSRVSDGFFASRLNYPNHKSAEPGDRAKISRADRQEKQTSRDFQAELIAVKKKAESRKESLKLLYKVLTEKEATVERLEKALGETASLLELLAQQSVYLGEQFNEDVNKKLEESEAKVESLESLVERLQGIFRGVLLEGSRQPQLSFGPEAGKDRGSVDIQFSSINDKSGRMITKDTDFVLRGTSGASDIDSIIKIEQLNTQLRLVQEEVHSLNRDKADKDRTIDRQKGELTSKQDRLNQLGESNERLNAQIKKITEDYHAATRNVSELTEKLLISQENLNIAQSRLQGLEYKTSSGEVKKE